jgi:hypothetical protein
LIITRNFAKILQSENFTKSPDTFAIYFPFMTGRGTSLQGGRIYFSFHQQWSKLGTFPKTDAKEAEMKKKSKFLTVHPVLGSFFDWHLS